MNSKKDRYRPTHRVQVDVVQIHLNGWKSAIIRTNLPSTKIASSVNLPCNGDGVAIPKRIQVAEGSEVICKVIRNNNPKKAKRQPWFAVFCEPKARIQAPSWSSWQGGKDALILKLPSTKPGSAHHGIILACWKCGEKLVEPDEISCIRNACVWTRTSYCPQLRLDANKDRNNVKECVVQKVRCACQNIVGSYYPCRYKEPANESHEGQAFPCFKLVTVRERRNWKGSEPSFATVLLGEKAVIERSIANLNVSVEWEIEKHFRAGGRIDKATMEKAKKAIQAQEMADERVQKAKQAADATVAEAERQAKAAEAELLRRAQEAESLAAAKAAEAKAAEKRARKAKQAADATVAEAEKQAKAAKAELLRRAQEAESLATAKAAEAEAAEKRAKEAEKQMVDSNTAANPQSKRIVWECKVEGVWIPYSLDVTAALESSFSNGMKAAFAMHSGNYEVDFSTMRQRNVATSFEREVRRGELERDGRTPRISWECKIDGGWIQYPVDVAQILQTNYEKKSKARFHLNNSQYEIDFQVDKLEQVNTISGFKRRVRRSVDSTATEAPSTRNVPKTWAKNATGQNCELVPVLESSDEWRNVEEELTATLPQAKLYQVLRVQNEMLWEYFCFRKDRATKLSGGGDPNVVRVWHGTRQTDPQVICKDKADGFMMQHSRCGMWGKGIYFAARASYSHDYAREESRVVENTGFLSRFFNQRKLTVRTLILAKLVAGEEVALQPDNSLRLCPEKRGGNGRYDTVTGTTNGSKVYVVYENGRAYPEYLVTYTS